MGSWKTNRQEVIVMAEAFTAGVKMGGLTSDTEIRLLLCYLEKTAGPVTRETLEGALLQEQLVNYFEFADALSELQRQGLICAGDKGFTVTPKGATVAEELAYDLPRSVRETAILAVIRLQSWAHRAAENHAQVLHDDGGYRVVCSIRDEGQPESFRLELAMPDNLTAEEVKNRFIARGSQIYNTLLECLTQPLSDAERPPEAVL